MTAEEFGVRHSGDHVEYINGEVREVPMAGSRHGRICFTTAFVLGQHVVTNGLGHLFTNDTFVKVPTKDDPERVYGADVCYVSYAKLAKDATIPDGILPVTPDLVVEVRSPTDRWTDAIAKMLDYIRAGVPVVVILDPKTRSASVFRDQDRQEVFEADREMTIPDVLPGFAVPVAGLFE
jgi:Uma2 family endonuclease